VGTQGILEVDAFAQRLSSWTDKPRLIDFASESSTAMLRDVADAIRVGRSPRASGLDGLRSTQVVVAAYESLATGSSEVHL
jgi:predicted dehydrogenase